MTREDKNSQHLQFLENEAGTSYEPEGKCGFFTCTPRCLQRLNNIRVMVAFQCLFAFFEGFIVNGIINVIIIALETRYGLTSKLSGLIASGNDFGAFFILLFIGHFAENRHKPKIMAAGVVSMAIGSLIFVLPHFVGGRYNYVKSGTLPGTQGPGNLCFNTTTFNETCTAEESRSREEEGSLYPLFLIGQIFLGIGSSPMFTIGLTYVDENSKAKMTSFYTGLIMCAAALGVAAGYVTAGQTLGIYVDIDKVDPDTIKLTPMDPRWVGAWWIGILVSMFAFIFITIPFCAYPKRLPGYNVLKLTRPSEAHGDTELEAQRGQYKGNLRDFPKAFVRLMKNPTFVLLCLAGCCEALIIAGTATFGAKLMQLLFHVDMMKAGMLMGIITVPGAGGGMILGGYLVKKFDLKCAGIIKLCGIVTSLCLILTPSFMAKCPDAKIAGITVPYGGQAEVGSLIDQCNKDCSCTTEGMEPLCVGGRVSFFSPCHAGCTPSSVVLNNGTMAFKDCSCIDNLNEVLIGMNQSQALYTTETSTSAVYQPMNVVYDNIVPGTCTSDCHWLYVFCVCCFFIMLFTFCTMTPNITAVMRCVHRDERSFAVGLQILAGRLLGTTPGPVLFGAILDSTCLSWQEGCAVTGSCWVYDRHAVSLRVIFWWLVIKSVAVVIYFLAYWVYKPPTVQKDSDQNRG